MYKKMRKEATPFFYWKIGDKKKQQNSSKASFRMDKWIN